VTATEYVSAWPTVAGLGAALLVTCRSAAVLVTAVTTVDTLAVLLVTLMSPAVVVAVAVFVMVPAAVGITTMVRVAGVPLLTVPRLSVRILPARLTVPWLVVA